MSKRFITTLLVILFIGALGNTRHRPNIMSHNYVLPIPIQIIDSNKDREIPQNQGY